MSQSVRQSHTPLPRRAHRGQTLIVAIAVMFVLLFIGGVFVAQVARNLVAAGYSRDVQDARALAEAGIRYCDTQLTQSLDGADWRPAPTPPMTSTVDAGGVTDPDYFWLSQGFARVSVNGGRALVRVTYDPHPGDPRSQLLKIEAVGRTGDLGTGLDPTVFVQNGPAPRLRAELIAYKQIGITDYLRFFTHKDRQSVEDFLGVPAIGVPLAMELGDPTMVNGPTATNQGANGNFTDLRIGAAIRDNGNLRLGGSLFFYENNTARPFEGIQSGGQFLLDPNSTVYVNQDPNAQTLNANNQILASTDPNRITNGGIVRDSSTQPDQFGNSNNIPHLDPPSLDTLADGTGVLRYRALTRDSGFWFYNQTTNRRYNTGQNGWGTGIYINNTADQQKETTRGGLAGSYSLRADWLNPNNQFAQSYWQGTFYRPPGVLIELLGDRIRLTRSDDQSFLNPDGTPITAQGGKVIEIPLSDLDRQNFVLPNGTSYPLPLLPHDGDEAGPNSPFGDKNSYGVNLVIMAEGNVRVKGAYGVVTNSADTATAHLGRVHLTIVSGGTAYIEGNVVKGDGYINGSGGTQTMERASTCAILAHDYITVNTTMFMSPQNATNVFSRVSPDLDSYYAEVGLSRPTFDMSFSFGVPVSAYTTTVNNAAQASPLFLLLNHASLNPGPAYINLLFNPALVNQPGNPPFNPLYLFDLAPGPPLMPQETYVVGARFFNNVLTTDPSGVGIAPKFEMRAFPLNLNGTAYPYLGTQYNGQNVQLPAVQTPGLDNILRFQTDQTIFQSGQPLLAPTDYLLGGAAVEPLDIRIEALLYAQEHSFFVIPGYPANTNPDDNRQAFIANGRRSSYSTDQSGKLIDNQPDSLNPGGGTSNNSFQQAKDIYPFYNEPMDVRITIFGAVSENYSASENDQAAWMARWGYIPATYGSTGYYNVPAIQIPDDHLMVHDPAGYVPGEDRTVDLRLAAEKNATGFIGGITRGLRFIYDPALALPYQRPTNMALDGDSTDPTKNTDPAYLRNHAALRVKVWAQQMSPQNNNTQLLPEIRQILPPMPRLPVCPGLLYFGDSERLIGT